MKLNMYFVSLGIILFFSPASFAYMASTNYSIPTSVISGGGALISSANYQTNVTLGQSSPITPADSEDFEAYPGFWYTLSKPFCPWDLEPTYPNGDGDVDGLDLDVFILNYDPAIHLEGFANGFGKTDCSD
ncbi:MAG: hypothetical protein DRH93_15685 [Deltaproteobacteria bacterium]|nr:MAG: hypothetical protein DRH93_15685 [Deltaproteobacteria bacterium]